MTRYGSYWVDVFGQQGVGFALLTASEEIGELIGLVVLVCALLSYLSSQTKEIQIRIQWGLNRG